MGEIERQKIIQFSVYFPYNLSEEQMHFVFWDLKRYMWMQHGIAFDGASDVTPPKEEE